MATTRTGSFPIGFRIGGSDWQQDTPGLIAWAKDNGFEVLDVSRPDIETVKQITSAGLRIGSVDMLKPWNELFDADKSVREAAVPKHVNFIKQCADFGVTNFFVVMLPADKEAKRADNFALMVESFRAICAGLKGTEARIALEGYPGGGPFYPALCCTPADYRAAFEQIDSDHMGVNFDPSHLIRLGIDPVRFVMEFKSRIFHVHGKDTEVFDELLYEHGHQQPPTFAQTPRWGGAYWRYTIPGQGVARWGTMFSILNDAGYSGAVSIELEDKNFNGSEPGEKQGLIASRDFLANV